MRKFFPFLDNIAAKNLWKKPKLQLTLCCKRYGTRFPYLDNIRGEELVEEAKATIEAVLYRAWHLWFAYLDNIRGEELVEEAKATIEAVL
jgi:hypothetical protein